MIRKQAVQPATARTPTGGGGQETLRQDWGWRGFYKSGAVAALLAAVFFRRNLDVEWMRLRGAGIIATGPLDYPANASGWLQLLQQHPLVGLTLLNVFDLVNYALVGLAFIALAAGLRKIQPARMALAAGLVLVCVGYAFAMNQAWDLWRLSAAFQAAGDAAGQAAVLSAAEAALVVHQRITYSNQTLNLPFLLASLAGLLIALGMRQSPRLPRPAAWMGILAHGLQLGYYPVSIAAQDWIALPIAISAVFLLVWYLQIATWLWKMDGTGCYVPYSIH